MPANRDTSRLLRNACALLGSAVLFGWSVAQWLSNSQTADVLWPSDINLTVGILLGGSEVDDVIGAGRLQFSAIPVVLRLSGLALVISVAMWFLLRSQRDRVPVALRQMALLWLLSCAWWVLYILAELLPNTGLRWLLLSGLPLWVPLTAAGTCWIWWEALHPPGLNPNTSTQPVWLLGVCMVAWIAVSYWMNHQLYQGVMIPHGDSAMYEEHLWNVWHGKGFRSYLDQGLFLGEHIQVIHLLLLPLHMLWPSHLLLEMTESIALGSCAIPMYRIVRRHSNDGWAAALMGVAWLLYYPMHFLDIAIDQKSFRPVALALPFLFWMIDCAERRRWGWATLCLFVALSAKEDVALVTFPLGCVLAWRSRGTMETGDWRMANDSDGRSLAGVWWGIGAAVFSAAYLLLAVLVIIPAFRSGAVVHYSRYFGDLGGSPAELVKTAITEPSRVLSRVFGFRTVLYLLVFTAPLGFIPWRRPLILAGGVLTFGMLSLLQLGDESSEFPPVPYHHFHAPLLPVLFWAAAMGLGRCGSPVVDPRTGSEIREQRAKAGPGLSAPGSSLHTPRSSRSGSRLVFLCCLFTGVTGSLMPVGATFWSAASSYGLRSLYTPGERAAMLPRVLMQVPMDARVASTDYVHTRLTHRDRSYDYSDYPRAVSNYEDRVPSDTDYIVIDTGHRYSTIRQPEDVRELQREPETWDVLPDRTQGLFIILKRRTKASAASSR